LHAVPNAHCYSQPRLRGWTYGSELQASRSASAGTRQVSHRVRRIPAGLAFRLLELQFPVPPSELLRLLPKQGPGRAETKLGISEGQSAAGCRKSGIIGGEGHSADLEWREGMLRWYLVRTKPSSEAVAQANLCRQGYDVYLPRAVQTVKNCGRPCQRIVALFPRYLFLRLKEGQQALNPVHFTVGVSKVVQFGWRYTIVPDQVIDELRARADPNTGLHRLNCTARLVAGAPVRITMGAFDGLEGVFEREAGTERVVLLLGFLGQEVSVCVPANAIVFCQTGLRRRHPGPIQERSASGFDRTSAGSSHLL